MDPVTGREAAARVAGMINAKFQVHAYSVDVTVCKVYAVDPTGEIDFGGSEYRAAGRIGVATHSRRAEDRYQWWDLSRGSYFVEFNETLSLAEDEIAVLEPDERLLRAGAAHVPLMLRGRVAPLETLLEVTAMHILLKQNARISRVRVFRFAAAKPIGRAAGKGAKKAARKRK